MGEISQDEMMAKKSFGHDGFLLLLIVGACLTSCASEFDSEGPQAGQAEGQGQTFNSGGSGIGPNEPIATGSTAALASGGGPNATASGGSGGGVLEPGTGGSTSEYQGVCKRGVPFDRWVEPQPTLADLDVLSPATFWFYNWKASPNPDLDYASRNFEFVPMIWNGEFDSQGAIDEIPAGATHLLGFNEPMISGQGGVDMTLEQVINRWPDVEKVAEARGLTLVSPAMTFSNIPGRRDGPEFMEAFMSACPQCRIDAIAVHTYTCEVEWVRDHIEPYRKFGLPIWVTEFACFDGDKERVKRFMRETVEFFEKDPIIERYAWFMSRSGEVSLLDTSGQLTELGQIYVNQPYNEDCER